MRSPALRQGATGRRRTALRGKGLPRIPPLGATALAQESRQMHAALHIQTSPAESVTQLLHDSRNGHPDAWNRIYSLVYADLHRVARAHLRRQLRPEFSPTSLISETWLRLASAAADASCQSHLTSLFARAMRFVLVDEARRRLTEKRGEGGEWLSLESAADAGEESFESLLSLSQALESLEQVDERLVQVVELRYFGGLNDLEIAQVLDVNERTVRRDWRKARAYLIRQLEGDDADAA